MANSKIVLLLAACWCTQGFAQQEREVTTQWHGWTSINTTAHLSTKWGVLGDFHLRQNLTEGRNDFYFLRLGANYWFRPNVSLAFGIANLWKSPLQKQDQQYARENRIYQQLLLASSIGNVGLVQRIRNEQRWQQVVVNDEFTGNYRFSNRVRYLVSFGIPLSPQPKKTSLVLSDEILVQFGQAAVYNVFDQNRLFIGFRSRLSPSLSCDYGYMNVYQQRITGYQYNMFHTLRLFFYYNPDLRKSKQGKLQLIDVREE